MKNEKKEANEFFEYLVQDDAFAPGEQHLEEPLALQSREAAETRKNFGEERFRVDDAGARDQRRDF